MESTTELQDTALTHLSDGLELVLDRDGARWQMPGRHALYFEVHPVRAKALFAMFGDRFETRSQSGPRGQRRVLTPEPAARSSVDKDTAPDEVLLTRTWLTYRELANAMHFGYKGAQHFVRRHEDALRCAHITTNGGRDGLSAVVKTNAALVSALKDDYPEKTIRVCIEHPERELAPQAVTLTEPSYTYRTLGGLVQRGREAVRRALLKRREHLDFETRLLDGRHRRVVFTTPWLAQVMESAWSLDVTISVDAYADARREVAA